MSGMPLSHPLTTFLAVLLGLFSSTFLASPVAAQATQEKSIDSFLNALKELGPEGKNHPAIIASVPNPAQCQAKDVATLLSSMRDDRPLAANWLRLTAEAIAQAHPPQTSTLRELVTNGDGSDLQRVAAYELLKQQEPQQAEAMAASFQSDLCLPLRRIAIAQELAAWKEKSIQSDDADALKSLLEDARDIDQVDQLIRYLGQADTEIDRNQWLGFQLDWKVIGPFDNTDGKGHDKPYAIESQLTPPDFNATWEGKEGKIGWQDIQSEDKDGFVDINKLLAKHNGACVYLAANIRSDEERSAQIRMGSYNAIKTWVNGQMVLDFNVYHTNEMVDQYVADVTLQQGDNWVVIKLCQNEQKESWAQNWRFLFRVTDATGKTIER